MRGGEGLDEEQVEERMMEGGGGLCGIGSNERTFEVEGGGEPTAMRTLWLDNEEVPRCQPTPFTLHGSDPKVSTS